MADRKRLDLEPRDVCPLSPVQLDDVPKSPDQIAVPALDEHRHVPGQGAQRPEIGVIHVRVGEEEQIERRQLARP
jgi:hypothetical protein